MCIEAIFLSSDVLFDTTLPHLAACNGAFASLGMALRWDQAQLRLAVRALGQRYAITAAALHAPSPDSAATLVARKDTLLLAALGGGGVPLDAGARQLLDDAAHAGCKLAIVTEQPAAIVAALLGACFGADVNSTFCVVASGVDLGAPSDNGAYALALRTMGLDGDNCLAIGGGAPAQQAAQAAGIWTVPFALNEADAQPGAHGCPQLPQLQLLMTGQRAEAAQQTSRSARLPQPAPGKARAVFTA